MKKRRRKNKPNAVAVAAGPELGDVDLPFLIDGDGPSASSLDVLGQLDAVAIAAAYDDNDDEADDTMGQLSEVDSESDAEDAEGHWSYDVSKLDIETPEFEALPFDIQHEILKEKLERESHKRWLFLATRLCPQTILPMHAWYSSIAHDVAGHASG